MYYFKILKQGIDWPASGLRCVSVNCFGSGGSNVHAILDDSYHFLKSRGLAGFHHIDVSSFLSNNLTEVPGKTQDKETAQSRTQKLLVWTAADANALQRTLKAYEEYVSVHIANCSNNLDRLAYTLASRRSILAWRAYAIVDNEPCHEKGLVDHAAFAISFRSCSSFF